MTFGIDWLLSLPALTVMAVLVLIDVFFGTAVALAKGEVSSMSSYMGWLKKLSMFVAVAVGYCIEILYVNYREIMPFTVPPSAPVAVLFAAGFCWMEILSIGEKIKRSGLKLPWIVQWFLDRLKQAVDGPANTINLPSISINHVSAKDVKVESDHIPSKSEKRAARKEAIREVNRDNQLDRMEQQANTNHVLLEQNHVMQTENSAILKQQQRTAHGAAEDTVTEKPVGQDHGPQVSSDVSH